MRSKMGERGIGDDPNFRWRGGDVSRLEGFSDAVFGFSMTLLIVSLEVPRSYEALLDTLMQFPSFGISYLFLFFIWYHHYLYFRRYGLNDLSVVAMNGFLMFLVLFFVFPFRWLVSLFINGVIFNLTFGLDVPIGVDIEGFTLDQYSVLHTAYALGFIALFGCFWWFYNKALHETERLQLDTMEQAMTRSSRMSFGIVMTVAAVSIVLVWTVPHPFNAPASGWLFMLIWPLTWWSDRHIRRHAEKMQQAKASQD